MLASFVEAHTPVTRAIVISRADERYTSTWVLCFCGTETCALSSTGELVRFYLSCVESVAPLKRVLHSRVVTETPLVRK